jgi:hypothetical protein
LQDLAPLMPLWVRIALAATALACIVLAGPVAAGSTPAASAKKRCKVVKRVVHGKKKRVRVCRRGKPKPAPTAPSGRPEPGTQTDPIALGAPAQVDQGWRVTVLTADANRTEEILDAQRGDPDSPPEPLPDGYQFLLARVTVTRTGADAASFSPYSLELRAASGQSYEDSCGTLLDWLAADDLGEGQSATGDVCWKIASADVGKVLMRYVDPFTGRATYFSLGL